MLWLIYGISAALLTGCFAAGTLPGERWMDIVRGWDKVRFSVYRKDRFLAVMGVIAQIGIQTITGAFRLMTFGMGASMILAERTGEKIGEWFPGYPNTKEIESGNDDESKRDGNSEV